MHYKYIKIKKERIYNKYIKKKIKNMFYYF